MKRMQSRVRRRPRAALPVGETPELTAARIRHGGAVATWDLDRGT